MTDRSPNIFVAHAAPANRVVRAAVLLALYGGASGVALSQEAQNDSTLLQEVVVTANRREQSVESVPYNMSVVSAETLGKTGVTDVASLASQVPGLSYYNVGARVAGATSPIIRGVNATDPPTGDRAFRRFEQAPVGTYIGNSPIDGYFQLDDVQRIEVLRGPQGTLYGAGALGGALRILPNSPSTDRFAASLEASGGQVAHSDGTGYSVSGMVNIPAGDTFAVRLSGKYQDQPGFIDVYGLVRRDRGDYLTAPAVAVDPSDPVNSPTEFYGRKDWNDQRTFTGRASALWTPTPAFKAELAFIYSNVDGHGGPQVNPLFQGGAYPFDTRISFPGAGEYDAFHSTDQPFDRDTQLSSLDLSYDLGFATLSSTSSYYTTKGKTASEVTYSYASLRFYNAYYAGLPINPRYVAPMLFGDKDHTFTQEIRLVSNSSPDAKIDYAVGLFYEDQTRKGDWNITSPGTYERSVAQGCTGFYFFGATFPDCLMTVGPNDTNFAQADTQEFTDKSVFGEVTWHFAERAQITGGYRHFDQDFTDAQSYASYTFNTILPPTPNKASASKNIWKINPSYQYATNHYVYALWSQGFRRGGANSLPTTGIFREDPSLSAYEPDSVDNYEVGIKGRFENDFRYSFAVFDIDWDKPQISASLPSGNLAVYNAKKARSKGVEVEASGPLVLPGLSYSIGGSYADAEITEAYSLPANDGGGTIVDGLISGTAGERLPGSPKTSATATLNYNRMLAGDYELSLALNGSYKGRTPLALARNLVVLGGRTNEIPAYSLVNLSASVGRDAWRVTLYGTNLLDRRVELSPLAVNANLGPSVASLRAQSNLNLPRELGVRVRYSFDAN